MALTISTFFYTGINIYFNEHVLQKIARNKYNKKYFYHTHIHFQFTAEMLIKIDIQVFLHYFSLYLYMRLAFVRSKNSNYSK